MKALVVSADGNTVYAGGWFTTIGGATRFGVAGLNASTGLATAWNPQLSGNVVALALSGTTLYLGGYFSSFGTSVVARTNLYAIDGSTGEVKASFNPSLTGGTKAAYAFVLTGDDASLYVGGNFTAIGGQARTNLARVTTADGAINAWTPADAGISSIFDMTLGETAIYVAGYQGASAGIASVNTTTGAVNWSVALNVGKAIYSLQLIGTTLYVGGDFTTIGGQSRNRLAALDATNGDVLAWNPGADNTVESIVKSTNEGTLYIGGKFQNIASTARNRLASFTVATGAITSWDPNMNNDVLGLALTSAHLYAGGSFTSVGGSGRYYIAAFDVSDMSLASWAPELGGGGNVSYWAPTNGGKRVSVLGTNGSLLAVGGGFTIIGTTTIPYYAAFSEGGSTPTIQFTATTSSGSEATTSVTLQLELSEARGSGDATVDYAVTGGTATGSGTDYTLASGTATITATNTTTTIPITVVNDSIDESNETIIVTISNPSNSTLGTNTAHTYTITDDDTAGVTVTESGGSVNVTEGSTTDTYTVVLASQPTSSVSIAIGVDTQSTVGATPLTFTTENWNTPQTVTVTAVNDSVAEGAHTSTITHTATSSDENYNGISVASVTANITDNETAGVTITESDALTSVTEGGATDSYTVVLTSQPTASVTITVTASGSEVTLSSGTLTFTTANWNTPQTVPITAVNDGTIESVKTSTFTHTAVSSDSSYNGITISSISARVVDNDLPSVAVPSSSSGTQTNTDAQNQQDRNAQISDTTLVQKETETPEQVKQEAQQSSSQSSSSSGSGSLDEQSDQNTTVQQNTPSPVPPLSWTGTAPLKPLAIGSVGISVKEVQKFLNAHGFTVAKTGPGSSGKETSYFGPLTRAAVAKFQEKFADAILKPLGLTRGTGILGALTIQFLNSLQ